MCRYSNKDADRKHAPYNILLTPVDLTPHRKGAPPPYYAMGIAIVYKTGTLQRGVELLMLAAYPCKAIRHNINHQSIGYRNEAEFFMLTMKGSAPLDPLAMTMLQLPIIIKHPSDNKIIVMVAYPTRISFTLYPHATRYRISYIP
jgi:hypothetical protein